MKRLSKEELLTLLNTESELWVKYLKGGKVFARYCVFSNFEDNVFKFIAKSVKRDGKIVFSTIPMPFESIIFIGNISEAKSVYINKKYMDVVEE